MKNSVILLIIIWSVVFFSIYSLSAVNVKYKKCVIPHLKCLENTVYKCDYLNSPIKNYVLNNKQNCKTQFNICKELNEK